MKHIPQAGLALIAAAFALTAHAQDLTGTLKKIKDSGAITIGHRESSIPFSYLDDKQQPIGYSMDLCNKVVDAIKAELKLPNLKVAYNPVTSQNRITLMQNGTIDLECGSTTNSVDRQKQVSFGNTTFVTGIKMLVKADSGIKDIGQLNGKAVVTTTGTTSDALIKQSEKGKSIDVKNIYGKDHADSFLMVESGRAAAFVMDDVLLAGLIANAKNPKDFAIVGEALRDRALRDHDPQGRPAVQGAGRQDALRPHEVRRDRQDLRQVVHEAGPAQGHQHEPADEQGAEGRHRQPERQGRLVTAGGTRDGARGARPRRRGGPGRAGRLARGRGRLPGELPLELDVLFRRRRRRRALLPVDPVRPRLDGHRRRRARSSSRWCWARCSASSARRRRSGWSRIGDAYVEIFRNIPLIVQLFLWYQVFPELLPKGAGDWVKQDLPDIVPAVLGLGLYTAARIAEQVKSGILSLPRGQTNAGLAMGLTLAQVYRHVLLPMAYRIILPTLTSESMNIFKNSSVTYAVGVLELYFQYKQIIEKTNQVLEITIVVTAIYFILAFSVNRIMAFIETRVRVPGYITSGGK